MAIVKAERLWFVGDGEMVVLIAELGWRPPYWMGAIRVWVWVTGLAVLLSAWEYGTTFGVATEEFHVRSLATWSFASEAAERCQYGAKNS